MTDLPELPGVRFARLGIDDAAELQRLFERASDFFELVEGAPTRPETAMEELTFIVPGREDAETLCLGVYVHERLAGFAQLIRDYPKPNEWWLALLLLDPSDRSRGFGAEVHGAIVDWLATRGVTALWGSVLAQNQAAQRFWSRIGYIERERQPYKADHALPTTAILMSMPLTRP